jgi:hypothetical protein
MLHCFRHLSPDGLRGARACLRVAAQGVEVHGKGNGRSSLRRDRSTRLCNWSESTPPACPVDLYASGFPRRFPTSPASELLASRPIFPGNRAAAHPWLGGE